MDDELHHSPSPTELFFRKQLRQWSAVHCCHTVRHQREVLRCVSEVRVEDKDTELSFEELYGLSEDKRNGRRHCESFDHREWTPFVWSSPCETGKRQTELYFINRKASFIPP